MSILSYIGKKIVRASNSYRSPSNSVGQVLACRSSGPGFETRLRHESFSPKQDSIAHSLSLSPSHCPDMSEILLKRI